VYVFVVINKLFQIVLKFVNFSAKNSKKFVYYNEKMSPNSNFKRNFLANYNDSEAVVKNKNAPFFMIFPNRLVLYRGFGPSELVL
jgi:hypothetical protein